MKKFKDFEVLQLYADAIVSENNKIIQKNRMLLKKDGKLFLGFAQEFYEETPKESFYSVLMSANEEMIFDELPQYFAKARFLFWYNNKNLPNIEQIRLDFKDFSIIGYGDDSFKLDGDCPTCDYGTHYVNTICIQTLHNGIKEIILIENDISEKYKNKLSTSNIIMFFAKLTKSTNYEEFIESLKKELISKKETIQIIKN